MKVAHAIALPVLLLWSSAGFVQAGDAPSYAKDIQPILADRCYSCHGPEKQKGELRLDSVAAIVKGGKNGSIFTPGNPAKSTIYTLTILPKGDDDIMPAKGDPLTQSQTDAIRDWIAAGAKMDGVKNEPIPVSPASGPVHLGPSDIDELAAKWSKPDRTTVATLRDGGGIITEISSNGAALDVDLSHIMRPLDGAQLKLIERIANNVVWLDVHGLAVDDSAMSTIAKCKHVQRLHLNQTKVTSTGLSALKALNDLRYLNLIGTEVDDSAISVLSGMKKLESVYVMNCKLSEQGIESLKKALPTARIVSGLTGVLPPPKQADDDRPVRRKK